MKIQVKTLSKIKDICGFDLKNLIVSDGISISMVMSELEKSYAVFKDMRHSLLFTVNEEYRLKDCILQENDVLTILPPSTSQ